MYPGVLDLSWNLPLYNGHYAVFTCVDRLTKYCSLIPCFVGEGGLSASLVAKLFFDNIVRFFSVLAEVVSHRDPRFTACFG